jgi:hypothetical protein
LIADPQITLARVKKAFATRKSLKPFLAWSPKVKLMGKMKVNAHSGNGVRPITNEEIQKTKGFLDLLFYLVSINPKVEKTSRQESNKIWREVNEAPYDPNLFIRPGHIEYARVDLTLPDDILKRDFADYLNSRRANSESAASPFFKNQDFAVWYNSGVLPYLDLRLWEIESGQTFRWSAFVDELNLITDKPVGSEDACRKTAKALADKLLGDRTIRMLNFQAVKEQDDGHKKSGMLSVR